SDLAFELADWLVRDEGVDEPLVRSSFAHPLDVEAEEVEPLPHVHRPGLGLGQAQSQRCENLRDLLTHGLHVVGVATNQYDEESRRGESHPPPLAEPCVNLSAYTAPIVQPPGL